MMNAAHLAYAPAATWTPLCDQADLVPHSGVVAWHQGRQIALFYLPGQPQELYAVCNRDPRSGASVIGRGIVGHLSGQPVVAAPLYKQHFCLINGQCVEDPTQQLRTWPVRLEQGRVEVCD